MIFISCAGGAAASLRCYVPLQLAVYRMSAVVCPTRSIISENHHKVNQPLDGLIAHALSLAAKEQAQLIG
jgi:hypothetical protein